MAFRTHSRHSIHVPAGKQQENAVLPDDYSSCSSGEEADSGNESEATDDTDPTDIDDDGETEPWLLADADDPPELYIDQMAEFDESEYTKQDYADGTTLKLDSMEEQWYQFCRYTRRGPKETYRAITLSILYTFFDWLLKQRQGKNGRRKRGTKYANSLRTYWKQYRLVYERETGEKINGPMTRAMHKVLRKLAKKHKLKSGCRDKPVMYVEDLREVLRTNLITRKKKYVLGRLRIQNQLFHQLGGFTANRPDALLGLCYRHIAVTLIPDPRGGPNQILLEFDFEFTKTYLGIKDVHKFPIPEYIYDKHLILSPQIFLLGLIFDDHAFAAPSLTSAEKLFKLQIEPGCRQLPIPLRQDLDDVPVFRRAVRTLYGWEISPDLPLTYASEKESMKKIGEITGFLQVSRPYALRYGAGKAFNEDGNVSEALQNLMMDHHSIETYQDHYLPRQITANGAAIYRREDPQNEVMRSICTMSRWIDPRRPQTLTKEQSLSINETPEVRCLIQYRDKLKQRFGSSATEHPSYQKVNAKIASEKQRQRRILREITKERYEKEQPVRDIERQLSGVKTEPPKTETEPRLSDLPPEQKRLVDTIIITPPGKTYDQEVTRRVAAIDAVAAYCKVEEGEALKTQRCAGPRVNSVIKKEDAQEGVDLKKQALDSAMLSVYTEKRPLVCFLCLGNERLPIAERIHSFHASTDLTKHFRRKHLERIRVDEKIRCNVCKIGLEHKQHIQRHAFEIHGTVS